MSLAGYARPDSLAQALALHGLSTRDGESGGDRRWLAGGQSLLAAMKLGMVAPGLLIDLQDVPGLREIRLDGEELSMGAMATHASVAGNVLVRRLAPGLATLAGGIADEQVRQMGTLGGSLAHNDPAACWPAGVLAAGAIIVTDRRELPADAYFQGLYSTALEAGELIVRVRFPRLQGLHYLKFEQPASRFAMVGVAVARRGDGQVRVALTGMGLGVRRWQQAEHALTARFSVGALQSLAGQGLEALADMHASAEYRCHLAQVLTRRCVQALSGETPVQPAPLRPAATAAAVQGPELSREGFGGVQALTATPTRVWQDLLDPTRLQRCIPGCESLAQLRPDAFEASIKVGLGPLSVRFKSEVLLQDQQPPVSLTLVFQGHAGALGSGQGTARVRLEPFGADQTRLHWWVQVQLSGRLAQFGNRLVEATARTMSADFFERFAQQLPAGDLSMPQPVPVPSWWRRLLRLFFPSLGK